MKVLLITAIILALNSLSNSDIAILTTAQADTTFDEALLKQGIEENVFPNSGIIGPAGGIIYIPGEEGTPASDIAVVDFKANFLKSESIVKIAVTKRILQSPYGSTPLLGEVTPIGPQITIDLPLPNISTNSDESELFAIILPFDRVFEKPTLDASGTYKFRYEYVIHYELDDGTIAVRNAPLRPEYFKPTQIYAGEFNVEPYINSASGRIKIIIQPLRIDRN